MHQIVNDEVQVQCLIKHDSVFKLEPANQAVFYSKDKIINLNAVVPRLLNDRGAYKLI